MLPFAQIKAFQVFKQRLFFNFSLFKHIVNNFCLIFGNITFDIKRILGETKYKSSAKSFDSPYVRNVFLKLNCFDFTFCRLIFRTEFFKCLNRFIKTLTIFGDLLNYTRLISGTVR